MASASLDGVLIGVGNPLLDISASVPQEVLDRYELKPGNAILAEEKHLPLYSELKKNYQVEYIAGGSAQNTIRAAQWMIQVPKATRYIGCVGNDEDAKTLRAAAERDGVTPCYLVHPTAPTGTCAVLVRDKERSLVANLGAANLYQKDHFDSKEIQEGVINKAQFLLGEGFFLTVSPDTLVALGQHAAEHNKTYIVNLCAPFLIDFFFDQMSRVLPYTDVIFCNESEAEAFGKKQNWGTNLEEIALKLSNWEKVNKNRSRIVVFTQGPKETIVARDGKITKFAPIPCKPEEIVDTNGAGDSFVGGFLSRYVQGKSLEESIAAAHYCAWEVIRRSGCSFPPVPQFNYSQ